MRSRASQVVAAAVLLVCLGCPVLEMFDHWDHTSKTGADSEYTFVAIASCIGLAYSFAPTASKFLIFSPTRTRGIGWLPIPASSARADYFFIFSIPISPPLLALRI